MSHSVFCLWDLRLGQLAMSDGKTKQADRLRRVETGRPGLVCYVRDPGARSVALPSRASVPSMPHGPVWLLKLQQLCP